MDFKIHKTLSRLSCVARVDYNFWHKKWFQASHQPGTIFYAKGISF